MKLDIKSIHSEHHHYGWSNKNEPKAIIKNEQLIELETIDSSGGQLNNLSTIEIIFLVIGFIGQGLFASRFVFQWIYSEKKGKSYIVIQNFIRHLN